MSPADLPLSSRPLPGPPRNLWSAAVERDPEHPHRYAERWRGFAAEGRDIDGEVRLIDAMADRGSTIIDAGCGTGRVGGVLAARGHRVVGIDLDPHLVSVAREDHPGGRWEVGNLAEMDLHDGEERVAADLIVSAGNVLTFLAGAERRPALQAMCEHLAEGGRIVVGFGTDRGYAIADFEADAAAAGLVIAQRFATWQLAPWRDDAGFIVAVLERA